MAVVQEMVQKVNETVDKYGLLSPEDLADTLFEAVLRVSMPNGKIRGVIYNNLLILNQNQPSWHLIGSMIHESGHHELHAGINQLFYHNYTYFSNDRYELEADIYGLIYAIRWYEYGLEGSAGNLYDFAKLLGLHPYAAHMVVEHCARGKRLW